MRRLLIVAFAAALVAGCGGTDTDDGIATASNNQASPTTSASASASDGDQGRKFAQCMRDNGVPDFPDPGPDGNFQGSGAMRDMFENDAARKALEACRDLAPNGGEQRELDPAQQEQLRQWAQCMRDNGIDVQDPDPNSGSLFGGGGEQPSFDMDDPKFQKAMEACQDKFTFRPGQGS
ncbi:hypothetical protein [Phytohabitans rumicis]|nr:hypothetical protein [Phytohabitans rumicis]